VKFKPLISEDAVQKLHRKHGSGTIKEFRSLNVHHVKLPKGMSVEDAIRQYKAEPEVEYAEPNFVVSVQNMPNDPFFVWQDYLYNMGQLGGTPRADIHVSEAWDITTGDGTVAIAVLDMGADYNHPDLAANIWRNDAEFFGLPGADDDGNGYGMTFME
jgi:subtilisin family serine protease